MRRHFLLTVVLVALCAAAARAQEGAEQSTSTPFSISSIKSPFAMAGTFDGEYRVRDNSVEITISNAAIYLRNYGTYHGRRELAFINIGLATANEPRGWKIIAHSIGVPVGETMKPGDRYLMTGKMRFHIPKESSLDLTKCWLVVSMGGLILDSDDVEKVGYAFAHSDRNIFSPVLAQAAKK